ncbi:efflux RND transporter periplasmic adaptor subunit [Clostridium formicaceticum]|nr:efflux RND transporter periplasmic adaptor subunit [Clostridium formicaceticum]
MKERQGKMLDLVMKRTKRYVWIGLMVLALVSALVGCNSTEPVNVQEDLVSVKVQKITRGDVRKIETYSGKIKPKNQVNVMAKSFGEVGEVFFDVGDQVQQGDVLFMVDKKNAENNIAHLNHQIKSAEITIDNASLGLAMAEGSRKENQKNQSEDTINLLKIAYDDAKKNYEDIGKLYDAGAVSKQQYDQVKLIYEQTKLNYEAGMRNHELLVGTMLKEDIESTRNQLQQAITARDALLIQLKNAKEALEDLTVTSPIKGVVASRNVEKGELTGTTTPSFILVNMDTVLLDIHVPEGLINKIQAGKEIEIHIAAAGGEGFKGNVTHISPVADSSTFTYPVSIEIENKDGNIKAGMFAEAVIAIEESEDVVILPRKHLKIDKGQYFAYIVEENIARIVPVTIGIDNGEYVEIKEGLKEGQQLIIKGKEYIVDNEEVGIVE